ncbi:MAG: DegT/DnrJ/EryC1/StrS family aminotransferase [Acetobacteraceae bacterium]|nr:DegT/DnrJ/EryC1/StrS family aminotransferase [Acetobacteraceae bacterium]
MIAAAVGSEPDRLRVPFSDLSLQWREIADAARADLEILFSTSSFCAGPFVERFEAAVADYLGVRHAIGVNSGTSALHLALIAAEVGAGDKVLVPANTFIATIWAVLYVGAVPVLCDVEPASGNIDVEDAERRIDPSVRAIIPVHLYGQPANMEAVLALADHHGLAVIEDAAQAIGARYRGRPVGGFGLLGCFSFYPGKNLGAAGEAGLVTTDDAKLADRVRALRNHAQTERYLHAELGFNYRMEGIQGLVLRHKLPHLDGWTEQRRAVARRYAMGLAGLPLTLPQVVHSDHVYHLYVILAEQRDRLRAFLGEHGVETGLHYPVPIHRQPCLAKLEMDRKSYPVSDAYARNGLSLPMFAGMTDVQTCLVVTAVRAFYRA